jgi:hypothetical protein
MRRIALCVLQHVERSTATAGTGRAYNPMRQREALPGRVKFLDAATPQDATMSNRRERLRRRKWYEHRKARLDNVRSIDKLSDGFLHGVERGCIQKKRYKSESHALASADEYQEERGTKLRAYYCDVCGGWHLTKLLR